MTSNVNEIVKAEEQLPQDQLKQFCAWFQKIDSEAWDKQIEKDIKTGELDVLAQAAIADHHAGKKIVIHFASPSFWEAYEMLQPIVKRIADRNFEMLKTNF